MCRYIIVNAVLCATLIAEKITTWSVWLRMSYGIQWRIHIKWRSLTHVLR